MTDFGPTTNRIPFHLLSEDEQTALRNWPWGMELFSNSRGKWMPKGRGSWYKGGIYRGKPKPVVTSEWFSVYSQGPKPNGRSTREMLDEFDKFADEDRIAVLRIETCNDVSTAHLEEI